jgi:hypothetical protein
VIHLLTCFVAFVINKATPGTDYAAMVNDGLRQRLPYVTTIHYTSTTDASWLTVYVNPTAAPGHFRPTVSSALSALLKRQSPGVSTLMLRDSDEVSPAAQAVTVAPAKRRSTRQIGPKAKSKPAKGASCRSPR